MPEPLLAMTGRCSAARESSLSADYDIISSHPGLPSWEARGPSGCAWTRRRWSDELAHRSLDRERERYAALAIRSKPRRHGRLRCRDFLARLRRHSGDPAGVPGAGLSSALGDGHYAAGRRRRREISGFRTLAVGSPFLDPYEYLTRVARVAFSQPISARCGTSSSTGRPHPSHGGATSAAPYERRVRGAASGW